MTNQHPITPPPELVEQWKNLPEYTDGRRKMIMFTLSRERLLSISTQAAQYGADQELEACCDWLQDPDLNVDTYKLRAARRPKPPSLKEQALIHFESFAATFETSGGDSDLIRRALEQLDD